MAISEFEMKRCERELAKFLDKKRPSKHLRDQVDIAYRIENQSVEIFEVRPYWRNPEEVIEIPVAKTTYVKSQKHWKIFWQRKDLKWHRYDPIPDVKHFEGFLKVVDDDAHFCFFI